jgi:osomolarity two-component system, response regulator SKN7
MKEKLGNIKRKAPSTRRAAQAEDVFPVNEQMALVNDSIAATNLQMQRLDDNQQHMLHSMSQHIKTMTDEILILRSQLLQQRQITEQIIAHLSSNDERRRNSRHSAHSSHSSHSGPFHAQSMGMLPDSADEPPAELRRARELLNNMPTDLANERELEKMNALYAHSPPESATSSTVMFHGMGAHGMPGMIYDQFADQRQLVYPVGASDGNGIDPFHSDHVASIPYQRPSSGADDTPEPSSKEGGSIWASKAPRILLVEDDKICARIGSKFLSTMGCNVETAVSDFIITPMPHPS